MVIDFYDTSTPVRSGQILTGMGVQSMRVCRGGREPLLIPVVYFPHTSHTLTVHDPTTFDSIPCNLHCYSFSYMPCCPSRMPIATPSTLTRWDVVTQKKVLIRYHEVTMNNGKGG